MPYSIIPPILIVLSLVGIIVILIRKYARSKQQIDEAVRQEQQAEAEGAKKRFVRDVVWGKSKAFFLAILDGMVKFFRFLFFRLGSVFSQWSVKIKTKRQERLEGKKRTQQDAPERNYSDILERLRDYKISSRRSRIEIGQDRAEDGGETVAEEMIEETEAIKISNAAEVPVKIKNIREKEIRPMVSETAANPEPRAEIRDRLEELLIERVAANPKDIEAYERLGEYYMEIKSYEFAKECFKQVIKLDPLNRNVKYKMRRLEHLLSK